MTIYLLMMALAAVVAYLGTWIARRIAARYKVYTPIRDRDVHTDLVARLGGIGLFLGFAVVLVVASQTYFVKGIYQNTFAPWGILIGATLIVIVGVIDDVVDLRWWVKLIGQALAALAVALWGVRMRVFPWPNFGSDAGPIPIDSPIVGIALTVILIVVVMNAFNFIDGLDGLAAGVAAIGGLAFFLCSYWVHRIKPNVDYSDLSTLLMAILVGICVGFLFHNWSPAKIFMGDSGAMLLGLIMTSAGISATGLQTSGLYDRLGGIPIFVPILLPFAILLIPLLDLTLAVVRRTAAGKSPMAADRGHLHHRLLALGYSHRTGSLLMYAWTFVLAFGGAAFAIFPWQYTLVVDVILIVGLALFTIVQARKRAGKQLQEPK